MAARAVRKVSGAALGVLLALGAVATASGFEISVEVAPNVLNLQSEGSVVTMHTNIGYGEVYVYDVRLNGVLIDSWTADNQGFFVAEFLMDEIKPVDGLRSGDENELMPTGVTAGKERESFWGVDTVWVVDNVPVKTGR